MSRVELVSGHERMTFQLNMMKSYQQEIHVSFFQSFTGTTSLQMTHGDSEALKYDA